MAMARTLRVAIIRTGGMAVRGHVAVLADMTVYAAMAVGCRVSAAMKRGPVIVVRQPVAIGEISTSEMGRRPVLDPISWLVVPRETAHNSFYDVAQGKSLGPIMEVCLRLGVAADRDVVDLVGLKDPFEESVAGRVLRLRKESATTNPDDSRLGKRNGDIHANGFLDDRLVVGARSLRGPGTGDDWEKIAEAVRLCCEEGRLNGVS
jgi:hypothetical protein